MNPLDRIASLPAKSDDFMDWPWDRIEPYYRALNEVTLDEENIEAWLDGWTKLHALIDESYSRLHVASAVNTADKAAEERYQQFIEKIYLAAQPFEQKLKEKLLASGLQPDGFQRPIENIRADVEHFREENLPLFAEAEKLSSEYAKIAGAQTVEWDGKELTIQQLRPVLQSSDRMEREKAWHLTAVRQLEDRDAINGLWGKFLEVRQKLAANTGSANYRDFRWKQLRRFDYSSKDCADFRDAIEKTVVPAAERIYKRRAKALGIDSMRPWDVDAQPAGQERLQPFEDVQKLEDVSERIFNKVDAELGGQFRIMREENLLDLENRKGKAPGGFCTYYPVQRRPFIFMNAVGLQEDVRTLMHEAGHGFHDFACGRWHLQWEFGTEFAEVASMAMELLSSPYWLETQGGFYNKQDYAKARINHLENDILFWPYMAVVDGFQHWAYENPTDAVDPTKCDAQWSELWDRFMRGIDYGGLDDVKATGWHRKLHIFQYPLYYVEYGIAQLGAVQVWANSLDDYESAVAAYKRGLALGARPLPELFEAAGAKFAFNADTLGTAVNLMEQKIEELRAI